MNTTINEKECPLCKELNHCMVNSSEPCWCIDKSFPQTLVDSVKPELKNKACICARCADLHNSTLKEP
ncbi:MAG: hypothetical protein A6F70_04060 [Cycloclasticus sp. symbiont of Bathymodiolus heckerae]|nr:MAG: hypothetical protein A6F70_04060 [Cycloclasticus sp. symbiont of Bathymodiolus heckerae]